MTRHTGHRFVEHPSWSITDLALAAMLVGLQLLSIALMTATSKVGDDPFDSSLYWWTWLIWPGIAAAASFWRPAPPRPALWTAALMIPLLIGVALLGTLWHDPDDGASLWIAGEMFVIAQTGVTWFGAYLGATARHHGDPST